MLLGLGNIEFTNETIRFRELKILNVTSIVWFPKQTTIMNRLFEWIVQKVQSESVWNSALYNSQQYLREKLCNMKE